MMEASVRFEFVATCYILLLAQTVNCGRILLFSSDQWSHAMAPLRIAAHLENTYGHETTILLPESTAHKVQKANITNSTLIVGKSDGLSVSSNDWIERKCSVMIQSIFPPPSTILDVKQKAQTYCDQLFSDVDLIKHLKSRNFDMLVISSFFPLSTCQSILAYKLSVPFVTLGTVYTMSVLGVPFLPSVTPCTFALPSRKLSFRERMLNLVASLFNEAMPPPFLPRDAVSKYVPEKPYLATDELIRKAEMNFINLDPILDFAMPSLPSVQYVGGLALTEGQQLADDFKSFMDSAKEGAVIFSFGSIAEKLAVEKVELILNVLSKFSNLKVVFKYHKLELLSFQTFKNILIKPWIPQNDLLAHPNTRLFLTHCGNNGQFEALYHGIPMLGIPLVGDQYRNCERIAAKGYGLCLDYCDLQVDEIFHSLNSILKGDFKERISNASEMFRSRPEMPSQRAAFWVDHLMKFGGEHYRYHGLDMPFYKLYMLDVIGFICLIGLLVLAVIRLCVTALCKCFYKRKEKIH